MKLKILYGSKYVQVEVLESECRKRRCLVIGRYTHHSAAGASGCSSWTNKKYSCLTRDNHGCPEIKI